MKQEPSQTRPSRVGIPAVHGGEDVKVLDMPAPVEPVPLED